MKKAKIRRFVVDRRTWIRGEGDDASYLLRPEDGKMCCLGFVCKQSRVPIKALRGLKTPAGAAFHRKKIGFLLSGGKWDADWLWEAYSANDKPGIRRPTREKRLRELFAENGIELVFEN